METGNKTGIRLRWPNGRFYRTAEIEELKALGRYEQMVREAELRQSQKANAGVETKPVGNAKPANREGCAGCPQQGNVEEDYSRDEKGRLLSPRERVKRAQTRVLQKIEHILDGNCESARQGNYSCAKFVLDWPGVSDIRTPLVKPAQRKSALQVLLKKFRAEDLGAEENEPKGGQ